MRYDPELYVADLVCAAGGKLISRIRLQKIAYLLDQLGAESGFGYSYYHYGPYSKDLDSAILDAEAFNLVEERFEYRKTDGARYSIFTHKGAQPKLIYNERLRSIAKQLSSVNVTVLELAATAHWLANVEKIADWTSEIRRRKGSKTEGGRLAEATKLLSNYGLTPEAA